MFLTDYLIESFAWSLFYADYLWTNPIAVPYFTTTLLDIGLLGKLSRHGFHLGLPCEIAAKVIGDVPDISISQNHGLGINMQLALDIVC